MSEIIFITPKVEHLTQKQLTLGVTKGSHSS